MAPWELDTSVAVLSAARHATDGRDGASAQAENEGRSFMNSIIYIVGLVVVVLFILSFLGLR
ncbi:MAG: hypothetical protein ABGW82_07505 [Paracoccus sp. (in: a-proteobacteria)]|uniref:hypothetical protein n=1 Tax=Paracoccus sp. TaxID=267 RepID=UPI000C37830D|nr:hypothetical protein [Paracoccus sp. (in: a-proteobacteria)]MBA48489.1 hypothetical protein [Paracoccus sp. (in: a-proteobacteria)]